MWTHVQPMTCTARLSAAPQLELRVQTDFAAHYLSANPPLPSLLLLDWMLNQLFGPQWQCSEIDSKLIFCLSELFF